MTEPTPRIPLRELVQRNLRRRDDAPADPNDPELLALARQAREKGREIIPTRSRRHTFSVEYRKLT